MGFQEMGQLFDDKNDVIENELVQLKCENETYKREIKDLRAQIQNHAKQLQNHNRIVMEREQLNQFLLQQKRHIQDFEEFMERQNAGHGLDLLTSIANSEISER